MRLCERNRHVIAVVVWVGSGAVLKVRVVRND